MTFEVFKPKFPSLLTLTSVVSLLTLGSTLIGCSTTRPIPPELKPAEVAQFQDDELKSVVIVGINDLHGALLSERQTISTPKGIQVVDRGGIAMMGRHLEILRKKYGDRLLVFDAGDQWQGSPEGNLTEGQAVVAAYNSLGMSASTLGKHEFDFGSDPLGVISQRLSEARYPYVVSNLRDQKTGRLPDLPNLYSHTLIKAGGLKVGVIGVMSRHHELGGGNTGLAITDLKRATLEEAQILRAKGAQIIVLLANVGMNCPTQGSADSPTIHRPAASQCRRGDLEWGSKDSELFDLLESLPPGTVDAAITGHSHGILHHWVNNIPVMQAGSRGQAFNTLYLSYSPTNHRVERKLSRIEGPIPICSHIFVRQKNCDPSQAAPFGGRGPLIRHAFKRSVLEPSAKVTQVLEAELQGLEGLQSKALATVAEPIPHRLDGESAMGNMVADALIQQTQADVALVNPGAIRSSLPEGPVTLKGLYQAFPFESSISVVEVSGQELIDILKTANSGARGFYSVAGLKLKVIDLAKDAPSKDLNGDGRIAHWEVDRLKEVRTPDGKRIDRRKTYRMATLDYLAQGGDDLTWAMSKVPAHRKKTLERQTVREAVRMWLEAKKQVNGAAHPLINPKAPRIRVVR